MKIYAPVKNTNGVYASVNFVNGVGETDNPKLIEWFRSRGYKLSGNFTTTPSPAPPVNINEQILTELSDTEPEMMGYGEADFDAMTPNELRQWMVEHGYGPKMKNTRKKEKLLEILRG